MQEIQDIVNARVLAMAESGEIQNSIEEGVKTAINKAIEKQFESWGNITKQIEECLNEKLKIDLSTIDIPCYNETMAKVVNQTINKFMLGQAAEKLMQGVEEKLSPLPSEMTIADFVNKIIEFWRTDDCNDLEDLDDYATVEFEVGSTIKGSHSLKIWKKRKEGLHNDRNVSEEIHLHINDGKVRLRHGWNPTCLFDSDAFIFKAYASSMLLTKLEDFDPETDCDLSLRPEYD